MAQRHFGRPLSFDVVMLHCVTQYGLFHDVACSQNVALLLGTRVNVVLFASIRKVVHETVALRADLVAIGRPN